MLTKRDFQQLKQIFVTKQEFNDKFNQLEKKLEKKFVTKDEFKSGLDGLENKLEKKIDKTTDAIIELINSASTMILTELGAKIDDIGAILENHERRIEKLELGST